MAPDRCGTVTWGTVTPDRCVTVTGGTATPDRCGTVTWAVTAALSHSCHNGHSHRPVILVTRGTAEDQSPLSQGAQQQTTVTAQQQTTVSHSSHHCVAEEQMVFVGAFQHIFPSYRYICSCRLLEGHLFSPGTNSN